jgi:gamma-glutamyl-gamma-aminobutyrate hydrolase PuuD
LHYSNDDPHPSINLSKLDEELRLQYQKINSNETSIVQQLLKNDMKNEQIHRLKDSASEILKYANGFIIPGGEDIEPSFYRHSSNPEFSCRTILECALIGEAYHRKMPMMGVCRGAQLLNIFFGGTLHQHVSGQSGIQKLEWTSATQAQLLRQKLGDDFSGVSAHHQAIAKLGKGLQVVLKFGDIPKLLLSNDGNIIASQIHPECFYEIEKSLQQFELFKNKTAGEIQEMNLVEKIQILKIIELIKKKLLPDIQVRPPRLFDYFFSKISKMLSSLKPSKEKTMLMGLLQKAMKNVGEFDHASLEQVVQKIQMIPPNKGVYQYFLSKVEQFMARSDPSSG